VGGYGSALGRALAEHADAGHGARLPGRLPRRGHEPLGGPRHHAALRVGRGAVARRPRVGADARAPRAARRRLPPDALSADLPQVGRAAAWRSTSPTAAASSRS
jgi:hypothetical protein